MNIAESSAAKQILDKKQWTGSNPENADLIIINTCSVRETAETRVFGRLAHYKALKKKSSKHFFVLVTGCMASRLGLSLIERGADFVMGTQEKHIFTEIIDEIEQRIELIHGGRPQAHNALLHSNIPAQYVFSDSYYEEGRLSAFVPIMHGCNNFCSYCIVPYVRGPEISRSPQEIKNEIELLCSKQVPEITLLGQNVNSYSYQDKSDTINFPDLLEMLAQWLQGSSIRRVRFLSSHPKDFSKRVMEVLKKHPVFCRHIHLCVQHGSNKILNLMNRQYTREQYLNLVSEIKSTIPDISLSTDILVGFPGESEEDFEEVLTLMNEVKFLYAYMYHYNPRKRSAAYTFPNRVPEDIKLRRLSQVIELQKQHSEELLQQRLGLNAQVLVERESKKNKDELLCSGEHGEAVILSGDKSLIGKFIEVSFDKVCGNTLRGHLLV
jgi:tRNA-2-methylthio-N6-dimethylallyladenosine synthase